jgi:hypothetical protein
MENTMQFTKARIFVKIFGKIMIEFLANSKIFNLFDLIIYTVML